MKSEKSFSHVLFLYLLKSVDLKNCSAALDIPDGELQDVFAREVGLGHESRRRPISAKETPCARHFSTFLRSDNVKRFLSAHPFKNTSEKSHQT
ncbi:hypothetical protein HMPREF7215_2084 [Pyramidobacter piscolens W5455]|uniref:Secreted protein n=1 Tax=Pyramidobacter piscolens W5455 TaxID=352165 RepID=A0ABP2HSY8_9BACT|nr:hypothetical protein [Pyramidobacter piscolens]EFB90448.1 hypothetical protein HMPREF7215_2084 [Pyramidobacter piscolens W5455]